MIKTVAIYCRVSTEEQKKFGISINDQKNSLTEYCKKNKYKIYDYYMDEGVSAGSISKRKEFVRLLKDLDKFDLIIFTKLDRFSRNVRDANNLLVELDEHNTSFRAIDDEDIDTSTADGRFIFNLKVNLAEHERNKDSERINRIMEYKYKVAKTVCSGSKIFGYDIDENKHYIINEKEAEQIRELYSYYLKTFNVNRTYLWFKENIVDRSYRTVHKYLTDEKYIGKFVTTKNKEVLNDFIPAIIDEETFYKVQENIKNNVKNYYCKDRERRLYIFSGIVVCDECKHKMIGSTRSLKENYKKMYRCKQHFIEKTCSNKYSVTEENIEKYLKENILQLANNYIVVAEQKRKNKVKSNVSTIKNKMNKLVDLYLSDIIDKEKYESEYTRLQKELKEEEIKEKDVKTMNIDTVKNFLENNLLEIYDSLTDLEKQRFWRNIISKIIIKKTKEIEVEFVWY